MHGQFAQGLIHEHARVEIGVRAGEHVGGGERLAEQAAGALAERAAAGVLLQGRAAVGGADVVVDAAQESALKLKETTGIFAEGMSSADLLHGPIGAVGPDVPALLLDDGGPAAQDARELDGKLREAGAPVTLCAPSPDAGLPIAQDVHWALAGICAVVRAQQVARELTLARGRDPDAPPGLSKVTETH